MSNSAAEPTYIISITAFSLLSAIGAYLLLGDPGIRGLETASIIYGVGLALTFDEFWLWLHLGGSYWQRASFDGVVVIIALLGLVVVASALEHFRPHHWATAAALGVAVIVFGIALLHSFRYAGRLLTRVQVIEKSPPPLP